MDVRAVDTTNMAVKRAEMERIEPKDKRGLITGRITSRTSEDDGGRVGHTKSSTEHEHGQDQAHEEHQPSEAHSGTEYTADLHEAPPSDVEHILDVKV